MWRRRTLLKQLCEALWHVHSHGYAHGDVKLENVLVSLEADSDHATAHLSDFESARQQRIDGTRMATMSTTTGRSNQFTDLYVAPEILRASIEGRSADTVPTAAGDMFSYGVCCLFACCLPTIEQARSDLEQQFVTDNRTLVDWSREAANQADTQGHLLTLLESLLSTDAEERKSASQTLLHAFHNAEAALAASEQAHAMADRKQRHVEAKAAEQRRLHAERKAELKAKARLSEKQAADNAAALCRLEKQQDKLDKKKSAIVAQERAAAKMENDAAEMKEAAIAAKAEAKDAAAKEKEKVKAAKHELAEEKDKIAKKKAELEAAEKKSKEEAEELKKLRLKLKTSSTSPPMIYLSSSGRKQNTPGLGDALRAYLQGTVATGDRVSIVELNDAKPGVNPTDQEIYQTVKKEVHDLGYGTHLTSYKVSEAASKLDKLLSCLAKRGTICVVVGGETFRLADEFAKVPGLRDLISQHVLSGDLMYVSFSAGSIMAGPTVEIHTDTPHGIVKCDCPDPPGTLHKKDGFKLVPFALRPHGKTAAGKAFEKKVEAGMIKADNGHVLANCPVLNFEDGEAFLFVGAEHIKLPTPDVSAKIKQLLKAQQPSPDLRWWMELAEGLTTEEALKAFFKKRQPSMTPGGTTVPPIKIKEAIRVINDKRIKEFKRAGGFVLNTEHAASQQRDTLLFHGCSPEAAANVQAEGLLLKFASAGLLGTGLYGAPDPRKSATYASSIDGGKFLFVCRFNLAGAKHGQFSGSHKFHEYLTTEEAKVVVLWMIKIHSG